MFVKAGAIVPLGPTMEYVEQKAFDPLTVEVYPCGKSEFVLQGDDERTHLECVKGKKRIDFAVDGKNREYMLRFHDTKRPRSVQMNGNEITPISDMKDSKDRLPQVHYDEKARMLHVRVKGQRFELSIVFH